MSRLFAFVLVSAVLLSGCDAFSDDFSGAFEAKVTGAAESSLDGRASFHSDNAARVYADLTSTDGSQRFIQFGSFNGAIDGTGTFLLADASSETTARFAYSAGAAEDTVHYLAESGTLEITRFTSKRLKGTFSAQLKTQDGDPAGTIEGEFDAVYTLEGTL